VKRSALILVIVTLFGWLPLHAQVELQMAFPNFTFIDPVDLQHAGDGSNRLFVVEQPGVIWVFQNHPDVTVKKPFLDIQGRVNSTGSEEGLLGLAFHPDYENNGYFYVCYTASSPRRSVISRFNVSATNPDSALASSELVLLEVNQPFSNHNGGQIAFGSDGYLYIGLGDGGSGGDPQGNGQNRQTLLGALLRIDVDNPEVPLNYGIPPDNPYVDNVSGYREEIYAYGLRNPWRFSFDPSTDDLWLGDVGQGTYEEVDIIEKGGNYGWNIMEGKHCYPSDPCDMTGLILPIWEYAHPQFQQRSITGGYVYRGAVIIDLIGQYIYADYITGEIWALEYDGINPPTNTPLVDAPFRISSFGTDENNNLFLFDYNGGRVYRLMPTVTAIGDEKTPSPAGSLEQNFPNPFNPVTTIGFSIDARGFVEIEVFDVRGGRIRTLGGQTFDPGRHHVAWDARSDAGELRASGIYFYRLVVDGAVVDTRRMVLLK
jgi:hypothetical protein